ncbi:MAG: hypothetical protein JNG89_17120 [Planctomycetaceae bacterium]|nr:hypothetical protein [Planctomycetaceae bacterium]
MFPPVHDVHVRPSRSAVARACAGLLLTAFVVHTSATPAVSQQIDINLNQLSQDFANAQAAERDRIIASCRTQAEAAEEAAQSAQSRRTELAARLDEARTAQETARTEESAQKKEQKAALAEKEKLEEQTFAAQGPETDYVRAQSELSEARDALDEVIRTTLSLPPRTKPATEQERQTERAKFTTAQKAKLKASSEYQAAYERASTGLTEFNRIKAELLAGSTDYQAATERLAAAGEAEDKAAAEAKAAGLEIGRLRKELKTTDTSLAAARRALADVNRFLASIGAPRDKKN